MEASNNGPKSGHSIALVSGGLDSSLAFLKSLEEARGRVVPFFVDYGQYATRKEEEAIKGLVSILKLGGYKVSPLVEIRVELGDKDPVGSAWGRTIALVGLATMWAYTHGDLYSQIILGLHEGDIGPDCKPGDFPDLLNSTVQEATKGGIEVSLPIEHYTVEEIGRELVDRFHLPLESFYTCYWDPPCGFKSVNDPYRCPGCRRKKLAMEAAGEEEGDLLDFPNGNGFARTYQSELATPTGY